jgi:hypothetical protein
MLTSGTRPAKAWVALMLCVSAPAGFGANVCRPGKVQAARASVAKRKMDLRIDEM